MQTYTLVSDANNVQRAKSNAISSKLHKQLRALRKVNSKLRSIIKVLKNKISDLKIAKRTKF